MKKHFPFISFLIVLIMVINLFAACTIDTQQNDSTTNGTTTESEAQSNNSENTSETGTFQTTVEDNTANSDTIGSETTDCEVTEGETTGGETTDGETTDGETTDGETTDGETTDGETTDGETTDGETTDGETTDGETTECKHTSCTTVAAKPATCTEEGNDAYSVCNDCKAIFDEAGNKIDKIPLIAPTHKNVVENGYLAPTTKAEGQLAHKKCTDCNTMWDMNNNVIKSVTIPKIVSQADRYLGVAELNGASLGGGSSATFTKGEMSSDRTYVRWTRTGTGEDGFLNLFGSSSNVVGSLMIMKYRTNSETSIQNWARTSGNIGDGKDSYIQDLIADGKWHFFVVDLSTKISCLTPTDGKYDINKARIDIFNDERSEGYFDIAYIAYADDLSKLSSLIENEDKSSCAHYFDEKNTEEGSVERSTCLICKKYVGVPQTNIYIGVSQLSGMNVNGKGGFSSAQVSDDRTYVRWTRTGSGSDGFINLFGSSDGVTGSFMIMKYRTNSEVSFQNWARTSGSFGSGGDSYMQELIDDEQWHIFIVDLSTKISCLTQTDGVYDINKARIDIFDASRSAGYFDIAYIAYADKLSKCISVFQEGDHDYCLHYLSDKYDEVEGAVRYTCLICGGYSYIYSNFTKSDMDTFTYIDSIQNSDGTSSIYYNGIDIGYYDNLSEIDFSKLTTNSSCTNRFSFVKSGNTLQFRAILNAFAVKGQNLLKNEQFKYRITDENGNVSDWIQALETSSGKGIVRAVSASNIAWIAHAKNSLGDPGCKVSVIQAGFDVSAYAGQKISVEFAFCDIATGKYDTIINFTNIAVPGATYSTSIEVPTSKTIVTGDGSKVTFKSGISEATYTARVEELKKNGFSVYSADTIGDTMRATLTKGSEYYAFVYGKTTLELTEIHSDKGADKLPAQSTGVSNKICDTTVTQHYSPQENGMCYIFRLADGSFIVFDGGYLSDMEDLYQTLVGLKLTEEIHIHAWVITHDHDDHYSAFNEFAEKYADKVKLDYVMYAPTSLKESRQIGYYGDEIKKDVQKFAGATLIPVHAGMTFSFADIKLEILMTPELITVHHRVRDFNDTSIIARVKNDDGSVMILADAATDIPGWLVKNIGDGLKSDMVQIAHHGVEGGSIALYEKIGASVAFWPCNEALFANNRGGAIKQHLIESDYTYEHILQDMGTVTRKLSYRPTVPDMMDLMPSDSSALGTGNGADNARIEDGVLKYSVTSTTDSYVTLNLGNASTGNGNIIRLVVNKAIATKDSCIYIRNKGDDSFTSEKSTKIGFQGESSDNKHTYLIYLGNIEGFDGDITDIRLDLGKTVDQTVEIYSIEIFHLDLSDK